MWLLGLEEAVSTDRRAPPDPACRDCLPFRSCDACAGTRGVKTIIDHPDLDALESRLQPGERARQVAPGVYISWTVPT